MNDKAQKTRAKILSEFKKLYDLQGYEKTTFAQLSSNCGISIGLVRFYFNKKENLLFAINAQSLQSVKYAINKITKVPDDPLLQILLSVLFITYLGNKNLENYKQMYEVSENSALIDKLSEFCYRLFLDAIWKLQMPLDEADIWTGSNCAVVSFYTMIKRYYSAKLPLNYYRLFKLFCDISFIQINYSEVKKYHSMCIDIFESLDKDQFLIEYQEDFNRNLTC